MRPIAATLALLALPLAATPATPQGAPLPFTVAENGQSFRHLDEALASLEGENGTIRIAPGTYHDCAVQESGTVSYVAAQPGSVIFERAICEGKATLVLRGDGAKVQGIVFRHLRVPDGNGAGIRIEKGNLDVANTMFIDSQCGILSAEDPGGTIRIDHSTFSGLGKDPTGNGAHAVYVGNYEALVITNSRFERGTGGHYVKSRAPRIEVRDSSFDDSGGRDTNYMIDLSNGASGRISGNEFVMGGDKENYSTMITVAPEGEHNSSEGLVVENNRATLAPAFKEKTTFVGNWSGDKVTVRNNQLASRITPEASRWF